MRSSTVVLGLAGFMASAAVVPISTVAPLPLGEIGWHGAPVAGGPEIDVWGDSFEDIEAKIKAEYNPDFSIYLQDEQEAPGTSDDPAVAARDQLERRAVGSQNPLPPIHLFLRPRTPVLTLPPPFSAQPQLRQALRRGRRLLRRAGHQQPPPHQRQQLQGPRPPLRPHPVRRRRGRRHVQRQPPRYRHRLHHHRRLRRRDPARLLPDRAPVRRPRQLRRLALEELHRRPDLLGPPDLERHRRPLHFLRQRHAPRQGLRTLCGLPPSYQIIVGRYTVLGLVRNEDGRVAKITKITVMVAVCCSGRRNLLGFA